MKENNTIIGKNGKDMGERKKASVRQFYAGIDKKLRAL